MSEQIKHGGTAFPSAETECFASTPGMSLRDYFAAKAMVAVLPTVTEFPDENWRIGVALDAYKMADAMIAARDNQAA